MGSSRVNHGFVTGKPGVSAQEVLSKFVKPGVLLSNPGFAQHVSETRVLESEPTCFQGFDSLGREEGLGVEYWLMLEVEYRYHM